MKRHTYSFRFFIHSYHNHLVSTNRIRRWNSTAPGLRIGVAEILRIQPIPIHTLPKNEHSNIIVLEKKDANFQKNFESSIKSIYRSHIGKISNTKNKHNTNLYVVVPQQVYNNIVQQQRRTSSTSPSLITSTNGNLQSNLLPSTSSSSTSITPSSALPVPITTIPTPPATPLSQIAELLWTSTNSSTNSSSTTRSVSKSFSNLSESNHRPPILPGRSSILESSMSNNSYASTVLPKYPKTSNESLISSSSSTTTTITNNNNTVPQKISIQKEFLIACKEGNPNKIISLLGSYQGLAPTSALTVDDIISHDHEHGATPLHYFVASPNMLYVDDTIEIPNPTNPITTSSKRMHKENLPSPIMIHAAIKALIGAGADIDAPAANGSTPLHWAAGIGAEITVKSLLKLGASPLKQTYTWRRQVFGKGSGQTPLHWAAESNHYRIVELLSEAHAQSMYIQDERNQFPKDLAIKEFSENSLLYLQNKEKELWVCLHVSLESEAQGVLGLSESTALNNHHQHPNNIKLTTSSETSLET